MGYTNEVTLNLKMAEAFAINKYHYLWFFYPCRAADDFNLFVSDVIQTPASAIKLVKWVSYCPNAT